MRNTAVGAGARTLFPKTLFSPRKTADAAVDERQLLLKLFKELALLGKVFSVLILVAASIIIVSIARTQLAFIVTASAAAVGIFALHLIYHHLEFMMCSLASNALTPSLFNVRRPKRIFLVRHGESQGNVDRSLYRILPDNKLELTEKGRRQSFEAGRQLKEDIGDGSVAFYVSPYIRTRQTLDEILEGGAFKNYTVKENPHLREQEFGNFQDPDKFDHYSKEREVCGWFYHRVPGGESGADLYTRATLFLDAMFRDVDRYDRAGSPVENVVVVGHGLTMRMICMRYFNWSVEYLQSVRAPGNAEAWKLTCADDFTGYELDVDVTASGKAVPKTMSTSTTNTTSMSTSTRTSAINPWGVISERWQVGLHAFIRRPQREQKA